MSASSFDGIFQILKRRVLAIGGATGATWGICAAVGLLLANVWLDLVWDLSATARVLALLAAVVTGLACLAGFVVVAFRRSQASLLARQLDDTAQLGGEIISGYELQSPDAVTATASGMTPALAEMAVRNAERLASQVPLSAAAPIRPLRRASIGFGTLSICVVLMGVLAPRLAGTEWLRFVDPFGDHPPFSQTELRVEPGNTQVRYGDGLNVFVTTVGPPVEDLDLVLRTGDSQAAMREEKLPMFPDSPGRWRGSLASVTSPGEYFIRARSTRSHRFRLDVITVPELVDVQFRVTPPAYTRDAVYEGPLPQSGLSALAGAKVEVRIRSNRPLSQGTLELMSGDQHESIRLEPMTADSASLEVAGSWLINRPGTFRLKVTDIAGQDSRETFTGTITVLKDQVPFVRLLEPASQSLATPSITLPVVVSAEDDYGISRLQLYRSLNDSRPAPMALPVKSPPSRVNEVPTALPLSEYGLQPGDVIKLFARVEDNDPAGAKGSESPVVVIQIISDEELEQMMRTREGADMLMSKYQAAQRRMEALQEEVEQLRKQLEKRDAAGDLSPEEKESLEKLAKHIAEEAEVVRESAKHVLPYDIDKALVKELETLAKKMDEAAEQTQQAATPPSGKPSAGEAARLMKEVQEKLAQERSKLQKEINDPLETLTETFALMEDQNRFLDLYYRQRDLAERLASLQDLESTADPATKGRMRELEEEQRRNQKDLESLLNDIQQHAELLPADDPQFEQLAQSSREFVEAVLSSDAIPKMTDAGTGLADFSGKTAHRNAKQAADTLESFLSRCNGMGEQSEKACKGLKFSPGEGCLGNSLSQMLADSGFKPGSKSGKSGAMGAGGGFSARRSTLNNIGLYGQIPTRGNPTESKSGNGKKSLSVGGSYRSDADRTSSSRLDPQGLLKASGAGETAVPARYRNRVEQYFQRIADEAGK